MTRVISNTVFVVCVFVCGCVRVRACVRTCVHVCVCVLTQSLDCWTYLSNGWIVGFPLFYMVEFMFVYIANCRL